MIPNLDLIIRPGLKRVTIKRLFVERILISKSEHDS